MAACLRAESEQAAFGPGHPVRHGPARRNAVHAAEQGRRVEPDAVPVRRGGSQLAGREIRENGGIVTLRAGDVVELAAAAQDAAEAARGAAVGPYGGAFVDQLSDQDYVTLNRGEKRYAQPEYQTLYQQWLAGELESKIATQSPPWR